MLNGQYFKFAAHAGVGLSQVDGDRLSGFNKLVYDFGLEASYKVSYKDEIAVVQSITNFGSISKNTRPATNSDYFITLSLTSANILFAYRHNIGVKSKRDPVKANVSIGLKVHQLISSEWDIAYRPGAPDQVRSISDLEDRFYSAHFEYSKHLGRGVFMFCNTDIVFNNIASSEENDLVRALRPYYIVVGLKYQI